MSQRKQKPAIINAAIEPQQSGAGPAAALPPSERSLADEERAWQAGLGSWRFRPAKKPEAMEASSHSDISALKRLQSF